MNLKDFKLIDYPVYFFGGRSRAKSRAPVILALGNNMETYKKILIDTKLPDTFSGFLALCLDDNDLVIFGDCGTGKDFLKIKIEEVVAYHVYEEFCHPDMDKGKNNPRPPYSNEKKAIYYPALEVINSEWLNSFSDNRLREHRRESAIHYQFLSYSNIIDVIANGIPFASPVSKNEYSSIEEIIKNALA